MKHKFQRRTSLPLAKFSEMNVTDEVGGGVTHCALGRARSVSKGRGLRAGTWIAMRISKALVLG